MSVFKRNLLAFLGRYLALCVILFLIILRIERLHRYTSAIPEKIVIKNVVLDGQNGTPLIFALFPSVVRGYSCGGGVFTLSKSTIHAIESEGLDFFKDATKPRRRKYTYPAWQETPVPDTWTNDGAWPALACISSGDTNRLIRKITQTTALPGSYYTGSPNLTILVLPKLGLVVYNYSD